MTEATAIHLECAACGGVGCSECDDLGEKVLTRCPLKELDETLWTVLKLADLYKRGGGPPCAGASLDQAAVFVDAALFAWSEHALNRAELRISAMNGIDDNG